ncbi:gamma-secretase-activating protein isoform X1 [Nematostella vectensis]|uniref:gamma-secretase-activating protein isoform X1 n=1 Tax=Nematostella vectensis TaxID=45351 RepID=UPI002076F892|nr:gamma-secretase-activating protein isoform X1 [Nematostella vectensis]
MVELYQTFSFKEHVLPQIVTYRDQYSNEPAESNNDLDAVWQQLEACIVGQEKDGTLLVTWSDKCPGHMGGFYVSYVATYTPSKQHLKMIFMHDKKVNIIGASINQEGTLLAFTTTDPYFGAMDEPDRPTHQVIYKSFLAEIHPKNRIFSLNTERNTYQRVQFLYGEYQGYGSFSKKESHMLFLHHKEAIGLYHIPLATVEERGMIMSSQPRTERICDAFLWAQWDNIDQRLYCVYNKVQDHSSIKGDRSNPELMFSAFQLSAKASHVKVLNMPLPFSISQDDITLSIPLYHNLSMMETVSEKHFNMHVVTSQGSLYICLQHPTKKDEEEGPNAGCTRGSPASDTDLTDLEYSVYLLHHDCVLHCVMRSVVPQEIVHDCTLFFSIFNDFLMVLLPGYALHLLNGNAEHEPCHHVILQDEAIPRFSVKGSRDPAPLLLYLHKEQSTSVHTAPNILDSRTGNGYECKTNKKALIGIFSVTHLPSTRLALLHMAIVHLRDTSMVKKMIGHLCYDPASPECAELLKEYLIGSTYGLLKRQLDRGVLKLLPFTCVDTFRGHLEESLDKRRIATIFCTLCRDTPTDFRIPKTDKKKDNSFWLLLKTSKGNAHKTSVRFSLRTLPSVAIEDSDDEMEVVAHQQMGAVRTLLRRLSIRAYPSNESVNSQGSTKSAEFLEPNEEEGTKLEKKKKQMVIEKLAAHLQAHSPRESRIKTENIAAEYVKCQGQQSEALLRIFWSGLGFTPDTNPSTALLSSRANTREVAFFHMVERFFTSVSDVSFPFPPGFQTFFATLAFRSLDPRTFLRYIDNDVLQPTDHFVCRLIQDCGGRDGNSELVFQVITRLKHEKAKKAMVKWDHPMCLRYMSQHLVEDLLAQDVPGEREPLSSLFVPPKDGALGASTTPSTISSAGSSMDGNANEFPPLATLMSALRSREAHFSRHAPPSVIDLDMVEDSALVETNQQIDGRLGSVPF